MTQLKKISDSTGDLFHDLWKKFNNKVFLDSINLIKKRIKVNKFHSEQFKNKIVLDVGCGSGRWCVLAKQLGAKKVIGVDSSKKNVSYNNKKFKNIKFVYGDNTNLKIENNFSDITISQGVIHHTVDVFKSLSELLRVTKKNGKILLLVYGEHGFRWSLIKRLRPICQLIGKKKLIESMKKSKFTSNTIKNFVDDLFVPIQVQLDLNHLQEYLKDKKVKNIKIWSKNKTFDHEQDINSYLIEFNKLKKIFTNLENKFYRKLSLKIINSYISDLKLCLSSKIKSKNKRFIVIGQGNHRLEITK
mgnify:FL=1|tara:strand:- start:180 stop:1085 length:906 start_codon:yes stop_codon:yes gene_type:complete